MKSTDKAYNLLSKEIFLRVFYIFLCFFFCSVTCWVYEKQIIFLYLQPLLQLNQSFIYTSIPEAFYTSLLLCIWVSLAFCFPYVIYQCFCFFLPSFFPNEKLFFYEKAFFIGFFYVMGFALCRFYIIPELCSWFIKFGALAEGLLYSLQAKVSNYLAWSGKLYMISLCILQIPYAFWVCLQLSFWKNSKPKTILSKNRKYASLSLLLFCAIISPPDLYSQGMLFIVSFILYEYILWYSFLYQALQLKKSKKQDHN